MPTADVAADAPGRVNLIGEHTDYHEGFVLPTVIPQRTRVEISARRDAWVHASSRELGPPVRQYLIGEEKPTRTWLDYVQGVTYVLRSSGASLRGFDVRIASDVPVGSGLSSSAALAVSLLRALRQLFELQFDDVGLARIAQRAETEFVGAPVGIMDQMVCSLGQPGTALFLDTRTLQFTRVALPRTAELVVLNSGVEHQHAGGGYVARRRESFEAAGCLGASHLRDVTLEELRQRTDLPDVLLRRARHVVTENQRVLDTLRALADGDLVRVGELFDASHASLRDDYEVSTPEIDQLVNIARSEPQVCGARLTGGGFGGSVVLLARAGAGANVARRILRRHADPRASILLPIL